MPIFSDTALFVPQQYAQVPASLLYINVMPARRLRAVARLSSLSVTGYYSSWSSGDSSFVSSKLSASNGMYLFSDNESVSSASSYTYWGSCMRIRSVWITCALPRLPQFTSYRSWRLVLSLNKALSSTPSVLRNDPLCTGEKDIHSFALCKLLPM